MRYFIAVLLFFFLLLEDTFAYIGVIALLPNPSGDDSLAEYIEIRNMSCTSSDISGYILSDLSGKSYSIPTPSSLGVHESKHFPYNETKISLNNTGIETVFLKNSSGAIIDTYTYSGTQKDDVVLTIPYTDEICESIVFTGANSGTGILESNGSGTVSFSGTNITLTGIIIDSNSSGGIDGGNVLLSQTGIDITYSGSNNNLNSFNCGSILASSGLIDSSGTIEPLWLSYDDEDRNGFIDTLWIEYGETLTGIINTGSILLSSRTGGLYQEKIDSASGYVLSGIFSGNVLILGIKESSIEKTELKINNTVFSDLRLKSSSPLGYFSSSGKTPEPFYLTTSFSSYKNIRIQPLQSSNLTYTGNIVSGENKDNQSGSTSSGVIFPTIVPILQYPTNAHYASGGFLCVTSDCRINLTGESFFGTGIEQKDFQCFFGTGEALALDDDCNPNTYYFTTSGSIIVELLHLKSNTRMRTIFPVGFSLETSLKNNPINQSNDVGKPIPILKIDGKWKDYYEQIGDYEMNCYTFTCSLNFTAEDSYDPEGSSIKYLWIYGLNDIKTSKDPGSIIYFFGDHRLILRVIDSAGNYGEIIYIVHVLGPKPKLSLQKTEKIPVKKLQKEVSFQKGVIKKKFKKIKMEFFSAPEIYLQGKTGEKIEEGRYRCLIKKAKTCQMNFTITGALSSVEYRWYLDGREVFRGKNPKSWKLKPGIHELIIESYQKGSTQPNSIQKCTISVRVIQKKVQKVSQKSKQKKKKLSKNIAIIPETNAANNEIQESENSSVLIVLILFCGLGTGFLLRGRKRGNHSSL